MIELLVWLMFGLLIGFFAHLIVPSTGGGLIGSIFIGLVGAFVGGYIGRYMQWGDVTGFNFISIILAVGGALVILIPFKLIFK